MSGRLIGVSCGTYYHIETLEGDRTGRFFDAVIPPEAIAAETTPADVLLVACRSPVQRLIWQKDVLAAHLARGGTVIAGGESHSELWLPGVTFHGRPTDWWWWLEPGADLGNRITAPDHPLMAGMDTDHVTWHLHGHFDPPAGALTLATDAAGLSLLYVDEVTTPGRIIATTLDPIFHHGSWFMPATTRFLDRFLPNLKDWMNG